MEKEKNKFQWQWIYIAYAPYIILMAITYGIGVFIAMFQSFVWFWIDRDEYFPIFQANERHFRNILLSMFDD
jgi:hypothetical protein